MMKYILVLSLFLVNIYASKSINVLLGTTDTKLALKKIENELNKLGDLNEFVQTDTKKLKGMHSTISNLAEDMEDISQLNIDIQLLKSEIKTLSKKVKNTPKHIKNLLEKEYLKHSRLKRKLYITIVFDGTIDKVDHISLLNQYMQDNYSIEYLKSNEEYGDNKNINIKEKKVVGELNYHTLINRYSKRSNLSMVTVEVVQKPFVISKNKSSNLSKNKNIFEKMDNVKFYVINSIDDFETIKLKHSNFSNKRFTEIKDELRINIDFESFNKREATKNKKIDQTISKIHDIYTQESKKHDWDKKKLEQYKENKISLLDEIREKNQNIEKNIFEYSIKDEDIKNDLYLTRVETKKIQYGSSNELKREILSSVQKYFENNKVQNLEGDEEFSNGNLSTTASNKHKMVKFNAIHINIYLDEDDDNILRFFTSANNYENKNIVTTHKLKDTNLNFISVQQGHKILNISQNEFTWRNIHDFIRHSDYKVKDIIDEYCISESVFEKTPVSRKYYDYPAVCFKQNGINKLLTWIKNTTDSNIDVKVLDFKDWKYVASNTNQNKYCWGDSDPYESKTKFENYYVEDKSYKLNKVKSYPASKLGIYDMCGNAYEIVKSSAEYKVVTQSYDREPTPIEDAYTMGISDRLNTKATLRIYYEQ